MPPTADAFDIVGGSFRDPSGQVFESGGRLLRRINRIYAPNFDRLIASGLYGALVDRRLLVPHEEVDLPAAPTDAADKVIEPERIPFISYPFEWTFGQLKAAALATLQIQRLALDRGMVLKDASAYNIQFHGVEPVLIDTLSTKLSTPLLVHVHLHARAQARHGGEPLDERGSSKFGRRSMLGLIDHLAAAIDRLKPRTAGGSWADYCDRTNYSADAMSHKKRIVEAFVERERPAMTWDFGANTGAFSRLASLHSTYTVAFDADRTASERHFDDCCARREARVLPLVMDLANPSSGIGWARTERQSLAEGTRRPGARARSHPSPASDESRAVRGGGGLLPMRTRAR